MSEGKRGEAGGKGGANDRRARQAEELRANLLKRKAQAKARKEDEQAGPKDGKKPGGRHV